MEVAQETSTKQMVQQFKQEENKNEDICTVILKVNNETFGISNKSYDIKLFGKTMVEWVSNSVFDTEIKYAEIDFKQDFLQTVKNVASLNKKWTLVLFSDAPLFERKTFFEVMEYCKMKDLNVLKLTRGYVFKTEYLFKIDKLLNPFEQYFEEEDFITCYSLKQLSIINEILKNRILNYFMKNGVEIVDPASTFIDADVQIACDTKIEPFCKIIGKSLIEQNVLIGSFSTIKDSVICQNSKILGNDYIIDSFVDKSCVIEQNCKITKNSKVCSEKVIPAFCDLQNVCVSSKDILSSFCTYKAEED